MFQNNRQELANQSITKAGCEAVSNPKWLPKYVLMYKMDQSDFKNP